MTVLFMIMSKTTLSGLFLDYLREFVDIDTVEHDKIQFMTHWYTKAQFPYGGNTTIVFPIHFHIIERSKKICLTFHSRCDFVMNCQFQVNFILI